MRTDGEPDSQMPELSLVYDQLRALAARHMQRAGSAGHTLQPTAVVHEAWLKIERSGERRWESRGHFLAVAAKAMRQILIDHARKRSALKRGEGRRALTLDERVAPGRDEEHRTIDILALDEAMDELASLNARHAAQIEMRFFGGLNAPETADVLGVSVSTIEKDWTMARAWLFRRLGGAA